MDRDEVVSYFEGYARSFDAPVREGVTVEALESANGSGYRLRTSDGELTAGSVVVATGPFQAPRLPAWADRAAGRRRSAALERLPVPGGAAGRGGAGDRRGPVRAADRRGPAAGRARGLSVGGPAPAGAAALPGPRLLLVARARRVLREDHRLGAGVRPSQRDRAGTDRLRRRPRPRPARRCTPAGRGCWAGPPAPATGGCAWPTTWPRRWRPATRSTRSSPTGSRSGSGASTGLYDDAEARAASPGARRPRRAELDLAAAGVSTVVWATGFRADFGWVDLPVLDADRPAGARPRRDRLPGRLLHGPAVAAPAAVTVHPRRRGGRAPPGRPDRRRALCGLSARAAVAARTLRRDAVRGGLGAHSAGLMRSGASARTLRA